MPGPLQRPRHHQLDQVAEVQTRRRRVETHVERDRSGVEMVAQGGAIGGLGQQAAPFELVQNVGFITHGRQATQEPVVASSPFSRRDGAARSRPGQASSALTADSEGSIGIA